MAAWGWLGESLARAQVCPGEAPKEGDGSAGEVVCGGPALPCMRRGRRLAVGCGWGGANDLRAGSVLGSV